MNRVTLRVVYGGGRQPSEIVFFTEDEYFQVVGNADYKVYGRVGPVPTRDAVLEGVGCPHFADVDAYPGVCCWCGNDPQKCPYEQTPKST